MEEAMTIDQQRTPSAARRRGLKAVALTVILSFGAASAGVASAASGSSADARDTASAAPARQSLATAAPVDVTGTTPDGTAFAGTFTVTKFQAKGGVLYAVGNLTGQLGTQSVSRTVAWPVDGASSNPASAQPTAFRQTPGACSILTLNLGALDLNLLGLHVHLDPVHLLVEAVPGSGNLLGNLLCAVAGLLDNVGGVGGGGLGGLLNGVLTAIANLLNGILGGL
jgi:hypothetical protein